MTVKPLQTLLAQRGISLQSHKFLTNALILKFRCNLKRNEEANRNGDLDISKSAILPKSEKKNTLYAKEKIQK